MNHTLKYEENVKISFQIIVKHKGNNSAGILKDRSLSDTLQKFVLKIFLKCCVNAFGFISLFPEAINLYYVELNIQTPQ